MTRLIRERLGHIRAALRRQNGLFFPYEYLCEAKRAAERGYPELEPAFASRQEAFLSVLGLIRDYSDSLARIGAEPPPEPRWTQNWFPPLDAAVAYALTRHHRPATIIEIGGGHSSRFFSRAARDGGFAPRHVVVDPGARAKEKTAGLVLMRIPLPLEAADLSLFSNLGGGDVVSLDGSHKVLPGSDVDVFVGRVLPQLPSGVLVHVHDCFLPDAYPCSWANRVYNEQSALLALVLAERDWPCLFASHYVHTRMGALAEIGPLGALGDASAAAPSGIWFRRA